jgi:gliding motility associated protien GldN
MKAHVIVCLIFVSSQILAQGKDNSNRGPVNILKNGVVDGVVIKEELPVRSKVEYEHVRAADYVWSKRVFSRIDKREKINHVLFFPDDFFVSTYKFPTSADKIDEGGWVKHQERYSLWTIIMKHIMKGDIQIFEVADSNFTAIEDGYQFKYPIEKNGKNDFFDNPRYRKMASRKISFGSSGEPWKYEVTPEGEDDAVEVALLKEDDNESYDDWLERLTTKGQDAQKGPELFQKLKTVDQTVLRTQYENAIGGSPVKFPDNLQYINSACITAYNIKEDWFFDKERSILDRRIIAIAPVARLKYVAQEKGEEITEDGINRFSAFIGASGNAYTGNFVEKELFWLYFPELRDVIINYYVYNEQSDAQWMSFDDLFWKRKFSSTIFRVSDKFDREIEDYKYGVDALYESEKIKDDIRKWEIDVWNY